MQPVPAAVPHGLERLHRLTALRCALHRRLELGPGVLGAGGVATAGRQRQRAKQHEGEGVGPSPITVGANLATTLSRLR